MNPTRLGTAMLLNYDAGGGIQVLRMESHVTIASKAASGQIQAEAVAQAERVVEDGCIPTLRFSFRRMEEWKAVDMAALLHFLQGSTPQRDLVWSVLGRCAHVAEDEQQILRSHD